LIDLFLWVSNLPPSVFNSGPGSYPFSFPLSKPFIATKPTSVEKPKHVAELKYPLLENLSLPPTSADPPTIPALSFISDSYEISILFQMAHSCILVELSENQ